MTPYCIPCRKFTDSKQDDISAFETIAKAQVILQKDNNPLEAKALHFLINCFRGSEFKDRCQGSGNEASNNGQKWFQRLHRTYPQSEWAQKTPYYY